MILLSDEKKNGYQIGELTSNYTSGNFPQKLKFLFNAFENGDQAKTNGGEFGSPLSLSRK